MYGELVIDLHGYTEQEAYGPILNALYELENNHEIEAVNFITGKGTGVLQMVLERTLQEQGYSWTQNAHNTGSYIVYRNTFKAEW